jgi:hypothetical protein
VKSDLFDAALLKTQKTWKTYVTAICSLNIGFLIDWLGKFSFFKGEAEISVAGFKVVREALSLTYGLLFAVFIATALCESRLLKALSETATRRPESTELEFWYLSPFSRSRWRRFLWAGFFVDGYVLLVVFSVIHITKWIPPKTMETPLYVGIGWFDAFIFFGCALFVWPIYQNLRSVRHRIELMDPRLNFVVQHLLGLKEALIGCFVAMSFSWSVVEVFGD